MTETTDIRAIEDIGRLPSPTDNAAIAVRNLAAGTTFRYNGRVHRLASDVPEGHRFAVETLARGGLLLSWQLPFGKALRRIEPGEYLCNAAILSAMRLRGAAFDLPPTANFQNAAASFELDENAYQAGAQLPPAGTTRTFMGYGRHASRGTGTRNDIVILGTTSNAASFARLLESELRPDAGALQNVDAIVAVTHTEGAGAEAANNADLVLRTLAGFIVHPNVAAVLVVDTGTDRLDNRALRDYLEAHDYPLQHVLHRFHTLDRDIATSLAMCMRIVRGWYADANAVQRAPQPIAALKVALQCGGSDAFSGVSGNPLAGRVAREIVRHSGAANLAETDELIGAERYVLANTRDLDTARRFLAKVAAFKERVAWHGHSAEGNPSGGNLYRGLYNISLKSIGAARKKDPELRLDYVVDYAERMQHPGFYFMDSPGNDLESIAGQVAAGCNLVFFITGNGSVTNFPFVPTIKFVTTTARWNLLSRDMDVNAGRFQDGESMENLGAEAFEYALDVASGAISAGERAAHSQVSIWRNWCQTDGTQLAALQNAASPDGRAIALPAGSLADLPQSVALRVLQTERIGLIMPTSLCAGQIALRIASELNARLLPSAPGISRFVALPHTEGCGASGGENEEHYLRTLVGHVMHPAVGPALLLEHGCERTHNDLVRHTFKQYDVDPDRYGYASIQLDGGIEQVTARVVNWFEDSISRSDPVVVEGTAPGRPATIGLLSSGPIPRNAAIAFARLVMSHVATGGTVVIPRSASLLQSGPFRRELAWSNIPASSLAYGQVAAEAGCHIMATPGAGFVESITGLGGTGTDVVVTHIEGPAMQGHPMIPTLQVSSASMNIAPYAADLDLVLDTEHADANTLHAGLHALLSSTCAGDYEPRAWSRGHTAFQLTRGLLGVSL